MVAPARLGHHPDHGIFCARHVGDAARSSLSTSKRKRLGKVVYQRLLCRLATLIDTPIRRHFHAHRRLWIYSTSMGRFGDYGLADVDHAVQRVFQRPKHCTYSPHPFHHSIPISAGALIAQEHFDQQSNCENQSPFDRIENGKKWQTARL